MHTPSKSAPILVEYVKDWLAPTGGINVQFQDRSQVAAAITNSKVVLEEARRRGMEVIHASLKFEPKFKVLGDGNYGLRKMLRDYRSFMREQADFFRGFEPQEGEYVIRERTGATKSYRLR